MRGLHRIEEIKKPNNSKTLTKKIHGPSEEDVNRKHCVFDRIFLFRCTNKVNFLVPIIYLLVVV